MMARRGVLGIMAGGLTALLSGCGLFGGNSYRFKMTVAVDTPEGVRKGSSVYEVMARNKAGLDPSGKVREKDLRGEAVAVDLPGGRSLFALLKTVNPMREDLALMSMAALDPSFKNDWVESAARIASGDGIQSPAEVAAADYPLLVTFADIANSKSLELVDPMNLAATFGVDVKLKQITIEVTTDSITIGASKRLVWLSDGGLTLDPDAVPTVNPTFSQIIRQRDFSTEIGR